MKKFTAYFLCFTFAISLLLSGCSYDAEKGTYSFHFESTKHYGSGTISKGRKSPIDSKGDTFELELGKGEKLHIDCTSSNSKKTMSIKFIDSNQKVIYDFPINKHIKKDLVIPETGKYYFVVKGRNTLDSFTIKYQFK